MPTTNAYVFQLTVSYNSQLGKFILQGENSNLEEIHIPLGIQMIYFTLDTQNAPQSPTSFPTWPIQWFDDSNSPVAQPAIDLFQWISATQCQLVVFNAVGLSGQAEQRFSLAVVSGEQVYITDPTIICDPPVQ
jgi:hypothetical protein